MGNRGDREMSGTTGGFLTKSIILLGLVLISMGGSMYLGKGLGRNIMAMTRSNLETHFPQAGSSESADDGGYVLDVVSGRTSFGYDSEEFGANQFPREWADPTEEEFAETGEEANVEITVLDEGGEEAAANAEEGGEESAAESDSRSSDRSRIFDLGVEAAYRIQIGIYSERANAESVWSDLTQAGYDASVSTYNDGDQVRYRVAVGMYKSREEADRVAEELRSMNFDAYVYQVQ
jgi:hypothetical protein